MHKSYNHSKQFLVEYKEQVLATITNDVPWSVKCFTNFAIEHLFDDTLTVTEAKKSCNITSRNFTSRFNLYTGSTPKKYILDHRINAAKYLLHETDHTVAEVSILVGFSTHSAFSKAFKKNLGGINPSKWAKNSHKISHKNSG